MSKTFRSRAKALFDGIVYQYPLVNRVMRNLNKSLSSVTSFRIRPYGTMKVALKSGYSFRMATNETSSVTKLLFWKGADNYEYTPVFEKLVQRCASFIDVGSNTGYYSLLAGVINPNASVYAIEPASAPYHFLDKNISINNLQAKVKPFAIAFSDRPGEVRFFEHDNPEGYHTKYNLAGTGSLKKEDLENHKISERVVPADTLDHFVAENKIKSVDLMKLDTEGTENLILNGAHNTLTLHKPIIICETLFNTIEPELERIMLSYGYQFFNHKRGKLYKASTIIRKEDNGVRDCFFVHPTKEDWVKEFIQR